MHSQMHWLTDVLSYKQEIIFHAGIILLSLFNWIRSIRRLPPRNPLSSRCFCRANLPTNTSWEDWLWADEGRGDEDWGDDDRGDEGRDDENWGDEGRGDEDWDDEGRDDERKCDEGRDYKSRGVAGRCDESKSRIRYNSTLVNE